MIIWIRGQKKIFRKSEIINPGRLSLWELLLLQYQRGALLAWVARDHCRVSSHDLLSAPSRHGFASIASQCMKGGVSNQKQEKRALAEGTTLPSKTVYEDPLIFMSKYRFCRQVLIQADYDLPGDSFIRFIPLEEC